MLFLLLFHAWNITEFCLRIRKGFKVWVCKYYKTNKSVSVGHNLFPTLASHTTVGNV